MNWMHLAAFVLLSIGRPCLAADWLQFRGSDNRASVATGPVLPGEWNVSDGRNVAWTADLPARGVSSPIVVAGRVIVTAAGGAKQDRLHVACYSAADGALLWHRQFWATGRTLCHPTSSVAAPTPASDGKRVFAFFSSNDLVCLDLDGGLQWYRGLTLEHPSAANDVGMAASPLVVGDTVVVQLESKGESFAEGVDAATGETRWRVPRTAQMNWTSPTVFQPEGGVPLVLLQSPDKLSAHDPKTGATVWTFESTCTEISSPAPGDELIFAPLTNGLAALRSGPNSSNWEKVWQEASLGPGSPSPVVHRDRVYVVNRAGVLSCAEAATGKVLWKLRVAGRHWATPLAIGDQLYFVDQDGKAQVVKLGDDKGEVAAAGDFGEPVLASPAYADGALYFRGEKHLWKIQAK